MKKFLLILLIATFLFVTNISNIGLTGQETFVSAETSAAVDSTPISEMTKTTKAMKIAPPAAINAIFPDPNLAKVIADELGMSSTDQVTADQLKIIENLDADSNDIQSLEGLEYCTGLQYLSLDDNQISDLTPLMGLANLTSLSLAVNQISELTPISEFDRFNRFDSGR